VLLARVCEASDVRNSERPRHQNCPGLMSQRHPTVGNATLFYRATTCTQVHNKTSNGRTSHTARMSAVRVSWLLQQLTLNCFFFF